VKDTMVFVLAVVMGARNKKA